jgi:hypothetical protein
MEMRSYTNRRTGEVMQIPRGIDPGWDYNPGKASWGARVADDVMAEWRASKNKYERLPARETWASKRRPKDIPADASIAHPGRVAGSAPEAQAMLEEIMGGPSKVYTCNVPGYRHDIVVSAAGLANHLGKDLARSKYFAFLPEVLERPYEVWAQFSRHKATGRVLLYTTLFKRFDLGAGRILHVVANFRKGALQEVERLEAWTMIPTRDAKSINKRRTGHLIYGRPSQ